MQSAKPRLTWAGIAAYCVLLFAIWTLRTVFISGEIAGRLGVWPSAFIGAAAKVLLWTVPAYWLVRRYPGDMEIPSLFGQPIRWMELLLTLLGVFVFNLVTATIRNGGPRLEANFHLSGLIGTVLFVGITEEMVFRGFLLNAMMKKLEQTPALVLSSALFVLIHFPTWYMKGQLVSPSLVLGNCISIFALGMIFGYTFLRNRNLVPPILIHMVWNLSVVLMAG